MFDMEDLVEHFEALQSDPGTPLNEKMLDTAALTLPSILNQPDRQDLIQRSYLLLPSLEQDPRPLLKLLEKLLGPVPLSVILLLEPPVDFIAGLDLAAGPYNTITLALLAKASSSEASGLATSQPSLLASLVRLWLCAHDEATAEAAGKVLFDWLKVDRQGATAEGLDGAVWRRVFRDQDVYSMFYAICSLREAPSSVQLTKGRRTIAQARLLALLPELGSLNWRAITQSYVPDVEVLYGLQPDQGLLDFASMYMVDTESDVLMHRTLITFYTQLLRQSYPVHSTNTPSTPLDYLVTKGIHAKTILYFVEPTHPSIDPINIRFLYGAAADYVATALETYPQIFTSDSRLYVPIIERLQRSLNHSTLRASRSDTMSHDLHVLASVPRSLLVSLGPRNPLLSVQTKVGDADSLNTIASLLHGPIAETMIDFPPRGFEPIAASRNLSDSEATAAQGLYSQLIKGNPQLWTDVVGHASTIALQDVALAALNVIKAVITANWKTTPDQSGLVASTRSDESTGQPGDPIAQAILSEAASANTTIIPFLLSPPRTFGNLVGGHGDAESAAYQTAVAKYDVLKALYEKVKDRSEYSALASLVRERLAEGTMGRNAEVGGRIATMEL